MSHALPWLWALLASAALPAAEPLPLEYFTRHDDFGELKISPDGGFVAASVLKDGEGAIVVYAIQPLKAVSGVRTGKGTEIRELYWASPERLVYTLAQRQPRRLTPVSTGEILAFDRDGGAQTVLYGYRARQANPRPVDTRLRYPESTLASAELVSTLEDDQRRVLVCEYPWMRLGANSWTLDLDALPALSLLNVYNGDTTAIERLPLAGAWPVLDAQGQARFATGYDAQGRYAVAWKPEREWVSFELAGFAPTSIVHARFAADGCSVLFVGTHDADSTSALYRLDLQSRAVEKLYAHPDSDIQYLVTDLADKRVIGVRTYADKPAYHWLEPDDATAKLYQLLERGFPGQAVTITSATQDRAWALAFVRSDVNPGDYYLLDTKLRKAQYLAPSRSWVDPAKMRPLEIIELEARDDVVLHGYLTRPRDDAGPYPLIVLPHGGPHRVRDSWSFDGEAQLLANHGYAVLQVNYRGSGGYGRAFEQAGYREWGGRMQDDLTDATLWALEQGLAQRDNICIYGASYGGYAALMGAVREPALYRCAASLGGVTDLELLRGTNLNDSAARESHFEDALGDDLATLRAGSPVHNAQRIQIPILLVHGKADEQVEYEHAQRMAAALEKAGKKFELLALSGEGHGAYDEDNRKEVYGRLLDFLAAHLRGGRPHALH
jgi:dipeptidyl aminopeptidase/acylaminoacyl peptidase